MESTSRPGDPQKLELTTITAQSPPQAPANHGDLPKFNDLLTQLVLPVNRVRKSDTDQRTLSSRRYELVLRFIRNFRWTVGDNIYPVARLLLPNRDNRLYYLKESKLGDLVIAVFKIPKNSVDYNKIKKWKRSAANSFGHGEVGFAEVCCELIKYRGAVDVAGAVVSTEEVNQFLDLFGGELSQNVDEPLPGTKGVRQLELFRSLVHKLNLEEIRFLLKVMLKLKVLRGVEKMFLSTWHPDAPRYLDLVSDLQRVLYQLCDQKTRLPLADASIKVGYPFKPQLLSRTHLSYQELCGQFPEKFYLEEKLDGERMQLHWDNYGEKITYFSRRLVNYTDLYGADLQSGSLSKFIRRGIASSVKNIVLDGEMVVFDHQLQKLLPFGFLKGSALSTIAQGAHETQRPMFIVFDVVYLNDTSLERVPLAKRREVLQRLVAPIRNVLEIVKHYEVSSSLEIEAAVRRAIETNAEGIILKDPRAKYAVAERNRQWVKVKPEYLDDFGEDVDVVIIGKTTQKKTSYMCGLRDELVQERPHFVSFCSIANGISMETYNEIEQKLRGKWRRIERQLPPLELLEFGAKLPEEWVSPEESVVIQVKARSIDLGLSGLSYKVGTTLYNAYLRDIRPDKDWKSSFSVQEYKELKLARSRKQKLAQPVSQKFRKRRKFHRQTTRSIIERGLRAYSSSSAGELVGNNAGSNVFAPIDYNFGFLVLSDLVTRASRVSRNDIVGTLKQNGARIFSELEGSQGMEGISDVIVISDRLSLTTQLAFNKGYDIIRPQWIFDSLLVGRMIPFEPSHCLRVSDHLFHLATTRVDAFANSYIVPLRSSYAELMHSIKSVHLDEDLEENGALQDMMSTNEIFYLLKGFSFYIEYYPDAISDSRFALRKTISLVKLYCGTLTNHLEEATHIIVPVGDECFTSTAKFDAWRTETIRLHRERLSQATSLENGRLSRIPRIVDEHWVQHYIDQFF